MRPVVALAAVALSCVPPAARGVPVTPPEEAAWTQALLPRPQECAIPARLVLKPADLALRSCPGAGVVETQALTELQELFRERTGAVPAGQAFEIVIGVLDPQDRLAGTVIPPAGRLRQSPYPQQAYAILPEGDNRLLVAALAEPGVYYGATTLRQLLEPRLTAERVEVPLATVVDWPALDQRGLWNNDLALIPWLATLKLSFVVDPVNYSRLERGKPVTTTMRVAALEEARRRAVHFLPHLPHDNFLHRYGLDEAYPELTGKGERSKCPYKFATEGHRAPCASNPLLAQITAEAMRDVASKGASEVSVWGSEHASQCECEACLKQGQFRNETQSAVTAWQEARQQYPDLGLRIFYCVGSTTREDTLACLLALPPEVRIEHCYGAFSDAFTDAARQGRWLADYSAGVAFYPQTAWLRFWGTWIRADLRNQVSRGYRAKYVITHSWPGTRQAHDYTISALAEWSWNLEGRDLADFALAWATRQGCARPRLVADWICRMDPIESDLVPGALSLWAGEWDRLPAQIASRKPFDIRSSTLFNGFTADNSLAARLAACQEALAVAGDAERPDLVLETRYVALVLQALQALREVLQQAPTVDPAAPAGGVALRAAADRFSQAMATLVSVMNERPHLGDPEKAAHAALWQKRVTAVQDAVRQRAGGPTAP